MKEIAKQGGIGFDLVMKHIRKWRNLQNNKK